MISALENIDKIWNYYNKSDSIVILGGTNDISSNHSEGALRSIVQALEYTWHANVILSTVLSILFVCPKIMLFTEELEIAFINIYF